MLLYLLAFIGGVLTIVSPCILPVLPFVFSRADQPFRRSGLPLLLGMAVTFVIVAGIATFAGSWIVRALIQISTQDSGDCGFWVAGVDAAVSEFGRVPDAPVGSSGGPSPGTEQRRCPKHRKIHPPGNINRASVGPLCRANPGSDIDWSGDPGSERAHNIFTACVFGRSRGFAGRSSVGRQQSVPHS